MPKYAGKICSQCGETRPLGDYSRDGRGRVRASCKQCNAEKARIRYRSGGERAKAEARERRAQHRAANPGYDRWQRIRLKYGLSRAGFDALWEAQGGSCGICGGTMQRPCVDHDHATGAVRGLLCDSCNTGLGLFRDDPSLIRAAAEYLDASL